MSLNPAKLPKLGNFECLISAKRVHPGHSIILLYIYITYYNIYIYCWDLENGAPVSMI